MSSTCNKIISIGKPLRKLGYDHSRTRVLNLVNFGLQTVKNRTIVSTHPDSTFSGVHISIVR